MAIEQATVLFRQLQALHDARHPTDRELLQRFVAQRDDEAVTALVRRHGPLVLLVGRSILGDMHAAEDVFRPPFWC